MLCHLSWELLLRCESHCSASDSLVVGTTAQSSGAEAFHIAIRHGLAEFITPVLRGECWVVFPCVDAWRRLSRASREAVVARTSEDFLWELLLEWWNPEADAETDIQTSPSSPLGA